MPVHCENVLTGCKNVLVGTKNSQIFAACVSEKSAKTLHPIRKSENARMNGFTILLVVQHDSSKYPSIQPIFNYTFSNLEVYLKLAVRFQNVTY